MHTFDHTYTFHKLLIEPEECLQGGSFQRFHDLFLKKTGITPAFLKFDGKYELNNELLKLSTSIDMDDRLYSIDV